MEIQHATWFALFYLGFYGCRSLPGESRLSIADTPLTDGAGIRAWQGQDESPDWMLEQWESVLMDLRGDYTKLLCPGMPGHLQLTVMTPHTSSALVCLSL